MKTCTNHICHEGANPGVSIETEIYYDKGGLNIAGEYDVRGYYLAVRPVTVKDNGQTIISVYSGFRQLIFSANRYSDKLFDNAVAQGQELIPALVERVLRKQRLEYKEVS